MRPTQRKSGTMHATVAVKFYPGRELVVGIIAREFYGDEDRPSKKQVEKAVRDAFLFHGLETEMGVFDDLAESGEETEALEWAEEQMMRLWPEWSN